MVIVIHQQLVPFCPTHVQAHLVLETILPFRLILYWITLFARGGAWRKPKPTGGPYVCEQCRLDACGGNDATLTMQAVTTTELAPADVCADCGARLLEELEVKDRA